MPDPGSMLERADRLAADYPPPEDGLQRLARFRERRQRAKRAKAAVFALALVIMTFGWLAWSLTHAERTRPADEFEGTSPSQVSTVSNDGTCLEVGAIDGVALDQEITIEAMSHLVVSFTGGWEGLDAAEKGRVSFQLVGPGGTASSNPWSFGGDRASRAAGTVTWSFQGVAPGKYSIVAIALVESSAGSGSQTPATAELNDCALTVFVIPIEG
jgi:hypothetical protein